MPDRHSRDDAKSDRELIAQTAAGDRSAFERLVERHATAIFGLALAITDDRASAEDALQQTFLSAYRSATSFRAESSVRTWLFAIARHAAYKAHKKRGPEDLVEEPLMTLGVDAGWGSEDPEALAIAAQRRETVVKALRSLSSDDQEVLILRDIEGLRGPEAAGVLGIGERALKSRLHRARLRLAVALRADARRGVVGGQGGST